MVCLDLNAQKTKAKPGDFQEIRNRPLIIEQLELDEIKMKKLEKKIKNKFNSTNPKSVEKGMALRQELVDYQEFVSNYNNYIIEALRNHFIAHDTIIYKTTSELKIIRKSKSKEYSVLMFSETGATSIEVYCPTLIYTRNEKKIDYSFFMPHDDKYNIQLSNLILTFKLMKNHINFIMTMNRVKYSFVDYANEQAGLNCSLLSGLKLYINENQIHEKSSIDGINDRYMPGEVISVSEEEFNELIYNEEDVFIGLIMPSDVYEIVDEDMDDSFVDYDKLFVNAKTGVVYISRKSNFPIVGLVLFPSSSIRPNFREKEFSKFGLCK